MLPLPDRRFPALASFLEIDAQALRWNASVFRELLGPSVRLGGVVKGNAYGHGLLEALPAVHAACDVLYAIDPRDALAVRSWEGRSGAARKQVLVLGAIDSEEAVALAQADVDVALTDTGQARFVAPLRAAGARLRGHVHLDTGLGREGFMPADLGAAAAMLEQGRDAFEIAGVLSHFANTEDVTEQTYAGRQLAAFDEGEKKLREALRLTGPLQRHIAASAAALLLPGARYDAVRVGIALYGLWPSAETRLSARALLGRVPELRPALSWRCPAQLTKWLPAGSYVGYGCTYRCTADTRIAVLPVGYFDGYPRLLSSRAHVLVSGQRCPVLGRVMMNHVVVDVTRVPASDAPLVATLLGRDGDEQVSADQLATWAQTIHYEIVTRIGSHLRRIVI